MKLPQDPKGDLQKAIQGGLAIVVAGTGVSISASYDGSKKQSHPQASWTGLLESGLMLLRKHDLIPEAEATAHLTLLKGSPDTPQFIATAHAITREMSDRKFREWLQKTVGSIKSRDRRLLDALEEIRLCGNLLATTNYDGLLLEDRPHLTAVTWNEDAAFLDTYRHKQTERVLFLHGHWDSPKSVILDEKSYQSITRNEQYRQDLTAVWRTSTWIYIGCGENGLSDPDVGLLLHLYGQRARQDGHWDFCLVRNGEKDRLQRYFNEKGYNICAVPFGKEHKDLPQYLRSLLPAVVAPAPAPIPVVSPVPSAQPATPKPPAFYAEPDYIGSHKFVGRVAELQVLSDWAAPADPTNLLLFEAIGGNGKSMLTWEWAKDEKGKYATIARPADKPWAGRFWYSFYEGGASMEDFCRHALAYMTGRPLEDFAKRKTAVLKDDLLAQLHARPWLLILDGLERILVAYHRIDAAEVPDEEANSPTDKIADRNPCDAIRDEDNDLLRALAAAAPSKLLVSSRLTPRVLLNPSGQPIPGAKRINLPGLRPPDAEALLRSCGIEGKSDAIQSYLAANCDNHPLVIGILGGLIANYLPARGDFDTWSAAPDGGAALDLARLNLIQRRNHILEAAIKTLPDASRQLLSTLALLTDSVDYETLKAFNPHLPPEPKEEEKPTPPENGWEWKFSDDKGKAKLRKNYEAALSKWRAEPAVKEWLESPEFRNAPKKLEATVKDLEQRGLLQWVRHLEKGKTIDRYDLHPVVRGVASGAMAAADRERHGQRVVDHFTAQPHRPYDDAETMEDVRSGLHVVRTLLKLGHYQQAADALYDNDLGFALWRNLEAYAETLSMLRPLFLMGWGELPKTVTTETARNLAAFAAISLSGCGERNAANAAYGASLCATVEEEEWDEVVSILVAVSDNLIVQNRLARALQVETFASEVATFVGGTTALTLSRFHLFADQLRAGLTEHAATTWRLLDPEGRSWSSANFDLDIVFGDRNCAQFHFWEGTLQEEHFAAAERLKGKGNDRPLIRNLHRLRGDWRLTQGEWALAAASYQEAVRLARDTRSVIDADSETGLALAKHHLGQLANPREEAERLAQLRDPAHRLLALLWLALGDTEKAKHHALAAYKWAWADGEPYVHRYELTKTTELLHELGVPIPNLPPYDPAKDEPFPWETDVRATIEKLRAEKKAKQEKT